MTEAASSPRRRNRRPAVEGVVHVALVRPARAVTVYVLAAILAISLIIVTILLIMLWHRTGQVCQPLRAGQEAGQQATTQAGRDFAATFGHSADRLGCKP